MVAQKITQKKAFLSECLYTLFKNIRTNKLLRSNAEVESGSNTNSAEGGEVQGHSPLPPSRFGCYASLNFATKSFTVAFASP